LAADPSPPSNVWLIADDNIGTVQRGEFIRDVCMVTMGTATHLSAIPTRPVLGRAAREAEIAQLSTDIDRADGHRKTAAANLQLLDRQLATIDALLVLQQWLTQPSPQAALKAAADSIVQDERQIADAERGSAAAKAKSAALRVLLGRLQTCSADAAFIDGDDWGQVRQDLEQQHRLASAHQRRIAAVSAELNLLQEGLDVLRTPPLTAVTIAALEKAGADKEATIVQANLALDRLRHLTRQLAYFSYADQVPLEAQRNGVLAGFAEQEQAVAEALKAGHLDCLAGASARLLADEERNTVHGKWSVESAALKALEKELDDMDCPCDAQSLAMAGEAVRLASMDQEVSAAAHMAVVERFGGESKQLEMLYRSLIGDPTTGAAGLLSQARNATRQLIRIRKDWAEFSGALKMADEVLCRRLTRPGAVEEYQPQSYVSLGASLGKLRLELIEVLNLSNGTGVLPSERTSRSGNDCLLDWMAVRRYLEQSLPRTITQSDNIEQALNDITEALGQMQEKQRDQEARFRTNAESVANSISNLVRREIATINRINTDKKLEAVNFGSISGIRILASRVERMGLFLDALRREPDLFATDSTLEEAMAMLYARSNSGSIDGAQLLDYRNYIQVQIYVRRLAQSEWDNNIGASSGEGIGVGAAILVVILDAMERQAETLQRRKVKGSVRFLMLDEANRLDTDALEMMASFCQATGVQLLVAAPEIAKARSGTTYCFVRRATSRGQEVEVSYRGRRGFRVDPVAP
jgi:chromosome partition protein MukB